MEGWRLGSWLGPHVFIPLLAELLIGDLILIADFRNVAELPGLDPPDNGGTLLTRDPGNFADPKIFFHHCDCE